MTRPGLFAYLCGNPVASLGSLGSVGWTIYLAYLGRLSYVPVVVAAVVAAHCWRCASQVQAYQRWRREWDTMNGTGKPGRVLATAWVRYLAAGALWLVVPHMIIANIDPPLHAFAEGWYWFCNVVLAGYLLFKVLRRNGAKAPRAAKAAKPFDVRVCVPKPRHSPDYRDTYDQLPDYCRRIISR